MQNVDFIVSAKWVIPMAGDSEYLENHSIAVAGEKIVDLLPTSKIFEKYKSDKIYKLDDDHVLLPGLINSHTHVKKKKHFLNKKFIFITIKSPMSLIRSYVDNVSLMDWLQNYIWPVEQKYVSYEFAC